MAECKGTESGCRETDGVTYHISLRTIPKLCDLCLHKLTTGDHKVDESAFPPGLRLSLNTFRRQRWLNWVRFGWLMNALTQAERSVGDYLWCSVDRNGDRVLRFRRDTRHVDPLMSTRCNPRSRYVPGMLPLPETVNGCDTSDWCIAVLAAAVCVLLMPAALMEHRPLHGRNSVAEVKQYLLQKAPTVVRYSFDAALIYVYWSRGYVDIARGLFVRHISKFGAINPRPRDNCEINRQRGLYFNELGRMLAQTDLPEDAAQCYRSAVDLLHEEPVDHYDTIKCHSLVLRASAYDQGIMDGAHAQLAAAAWDVVIRECQNIRNITSSALVSLLHCHVPVIFAVAANSQSVSRSDQYRWLISAESKLCELSRKDTRVYFHLSLTRVLLGKDHEALTAYERFRERYGSPECEDVPDGSIACKVSEQTNSHPWWIISTWLSGNSPAHGVDEDSSPAGNAYLLPILWRRILQHPSCGLVDQGRRSACLPSDDICGINPSFEITTDGFLTGTFQNSLPPITTYMFDLYTGRIVLPGSPTERWQRWDLIHKRKEGNQSTLRSNVYDSVLNGNLHSACSCDFHIDTFIPTPIRLFDNCGLLISNILVDYGLRFARQEDWQFAERSPGLAHHVAVLSYTNDSEDFRFDLRTLILEARRDVVLKEVRDRIGGRAYNLAVLNRFIDDCVKNGFQITSSRAVRIMEDQNGYLCSCSGKPSSEYNPPPQTIRLSRILYVGENTAILCLRCVMEPYSPQGDNVLVFLDSKSLRSFMNPVVHWTEHPFSTWEVPGKIDTWAYSTRTNQSVFFACASSSCDSVSDELVIFDEYGAVLRRDKLAENGVHGCREFVACHDWNIVGWNAARNRLISYDVREGKSTKADFPVLDNALIAGAVLFIAVPQRVIALNPTTLAPMLINRDVPGLTPDDGVVIKGESRYLQALESGPIGGLGSTRVFLGVANRVVILQIRHPPSRRTVKNSCTSLSVTAEIALPGIPTELCYVSQPVGFVVTATVTQRRHSLSEQTETLYWFDMSGVFRGLHLLLGSGPHGIIAALLRVAPITAAAIETARQHRRAEDDDKRHLRWHLYFADGFGGVCCLRIPAVP